MAKYDAHKVGEIHRLTKQKSDLGSIVGGVILFVVVLAVINAIF